MATRRAWLSRSGSMLSLVAGLTVAAIAGSAAADAPPRRFTIEGGDLSQALNSFSHQADLPVMTLADIRHRTSPGVRGLLTPEQALSRLIDGQNLHVVAAG